MKRIFQILATLSLVACGTENGWQGTGVGNPGSQLTDDQTRMSIATEDGLTLHSATTGVAYATGVAIIAGVEEAAWHHRSEDQV